MTDDKLRVFFKTKRGYHQEIDWTKKRDKWISAVDAFYKDIGKILKGSIEDSTVSISYEEKEIAEENIGKYTIREMILHVGEQKVKLSPKGCNIIGASGRIDLIGELGQKTIVMQPDSRWGIVATRIPTLKVISFEETSLLEALEEIML